MTAKKTTKKTTAKSATNTKATDKAPKSDKMSALDAAAKVLGESGVPMTSKEMIDAMSAKGYWTTPGGKTPQATLYAAVIREISVKGDEARFRKIDRGQFALAQVQAKAPAKAAAKKATKKAASKEDAEVEKA